MGTRADFYIGKNETAEWIGSIAWDGYRNGIDAAVLDARTEDGFRAAVTEFFADRDDVTMPDDGWPWPWKSSAISDCSYWFFDGQVWDDMGGSYAPTSVAIESEDDYDKAKQGEAIKYPDMSNKMAIATPGSNRSGIMVVTVK